MIEIDDDAYDERLDAIAARVDAVYPDGIVSFSAMPDDEDGLPKDVLDEVAVSGPAIFLARNDPFFGEGHDYRSAVLTDSTWMQLVGIANDSVARTGDEHHVFLEAIEPTGDVIDGVPVYELQFGS